MTFLLGYNTNGFAHHSLADTIDILADIGYQSVAITLDQHTLNPYSRTFDEDLYAAKFQLEKHEMECVIETGARFLLDPRRKHQPTLLSNDGEERQRRLDFLFRAVDASRVIDADAVSIWSGALGPDVDPGDAWPRLVEGCERLVKWAHTCGVRLAFEPEPGMLVATLDDFDRLASEIDDPRFGLTLDVGHVHCLGDGTPAGRIEQYGNRLFNVHVEDMRRGTHEHLMFGEGEMEFPPILAALKDVEYQGTVSVELSRHSHDAVNAATQAFQFLSDASQLTG